MVGPAFFMLLETSIMKGVRAALAFDFGVFISDVIIIGVVYFFLNEVAHTIKENRNLLTVAGGIILLAYGIATAIKKQNAKLNNDFVNIVHQPRDYGILFLKGFLLNFLNPMGLFYWFAVLTIDTESVAQGGINAFTFIAFILGTYFSIDLLKIMGAKKLRVFVTPGVLKRLSLILGLVLVIFGVVLIIRGIVTK